MSSTLKQVSSTRVIVILLAAVLILSAFNTYLIFAGTQSANRTNIINYDYVLSVDGDNYNLKDVVTGYVSAMSGDASTALNKALSQGKSVYLNPGTYTLTADVQTVNKLNAKIAGDSATIVGNGKKIVINGTDYTNSQYALVSGLTLINATIRVENSFAITIQNCKFINSTTGIEFANTNTWSEYNKIENCQFQNVTEGIAFRTPIRTGTGSYASSQIERCMFNLQDNSVGINVEPLAEFSDSQLQAVRFWMGENDHTNQTALKVDGSMYQTLLFGVVFECFTADPVDIYAIDIGQTCNPAPTLGDGVSFLGNWTARIHDPYSIWLYSTNTVFSETNLSVAVGNDNQYGQNTTIQRRPLTIQDFKPKIEVGGDFANGQTVTVRVRIEYIDNSLSTPVTITFTNATSTWLTDDQILTLFPSQSIIWAIIIDAKTTATSTDATVRASGYGTAG
jgi:hypothetical protein